MRGLRAVVNKQEHHAEVRSQSGTLDLYLQAGQFALRVAGLEAAFVPLARCEDQDMRRPDAQGRVVSKNLHGPGDKQKPEIGRAALRTSLLDSLEPGTVQWDHRVPSVEAPGQGRHVVSFSNDRRLEAALVVGADGAWSRVRPRPLSAQPEYSGVTFIEVGCNDVDRRLPETAQLVGQGPMFAYQGGQGLFMQRNGHGHIRTYVVLGTALDHFTHSGNDLGDSIAARAFLLTLLADWAAPLRALLEQCADRFVWRPVHMLPVGLRWPWTPGLTLRGTRPT